MIAHACGGSERQESALGARPGFLGRVDRTRCPGRICRGGVFVRARGRVLRARSLAKLRPGTAMSQPSSRILGTGHYLPPIVRTNHDLEKMVDTSDAWIVERTGIRERRIAPDGIVTSDMAMEAAKRALEAAELAPTD